MIKPFILMIIVLAMVACKPAEQASATPSQVVYRFDDHRYLTLVGYYCEGELWYTDTKKNIHSQVVLQFYRLFTKSYIHPSKRYLAVPGWDTGAFMVSKNYGKTWQVAPFASVYPGPEKNGDTRPDSQDVESFTVVNDQGFLKTKQGLLYISSKPFDDPRVMPGGPGIDYTDSNGEKIHLRPGFAGPEWGLEYFVANSLKNDIVSLKINNQQLPSQIPEVKNYTGWTHMRCDYHLGLEKSLTALQ